MTVKAFFLKVRTLREKSSNLNVEILAQSSNVRAGITYTRISNTNSTYNYGETYEFLI